MEYDVPGAETVTGSEHIIKISSRITGHGRRGDPAAVLGHGSPPPASHAENEGWWLVVALGLLALGPTLYQIYANGLSSLTGRSGELRRWSPGNWYARQERMCSSLVDVAHQLRTRR